MNLLHILRNARWIVLLALPAGSCVKTEKPAGAASLTIENAISGCASAITNFNGGQPLTYWWTADMLSYGSFYYSDQITVPPGTQHIAIFQYGDTLPKSVPLINVALNFQEGGYYTLFCVGTIAHPDTLFLKDNIPYIPYTDSVAGIRFANLSPGSAPISINITGQPYGSVVASLPYKGVTDFIRFPATSAVLNDLFEFRDAATGNLISTRNARNVGQPGQDYSPNTWQFKNNTIALIGQPDSTDFFTMQRTYIINNF